MLIGGIAGLTAAASVEEGQDLHAICAQAGANAVERWHPLISQGSPFFAIWGAFLQYLPGTRESR